MSYECVVIADGGNHYKWCVSLSFGKYLVLAVLSVLRAVGGWMDGWLWGEFE